MKPVRQTHAKAVTSSKVFTPVTLSRAAFASLFTFPFCLVVRSDSLPDEIFSLLFRPADSLAFDACCWLDGEVGLGEPGCLPCRLLTLLLSDTDGIVCVCVCVLETKVFASIISKTIAYCCCFFSRFFFFFLRVCMCICNNISMN